MSIEQKWRDFICQPDGLARHLGSIGRGTAWDVAQELDPAALAGFLEKLQGRGADVELLADAVELAQPAYAVFCQKELPALLDALRNERIGEDRVVGPALEGAPVWHKTVVLRRTGRIPQTHYISRISRRSFALPENMLVRWLVGSIAKAIGRIEQRIGSAGLPPHFLSISAACAEARAHQWFQLVAPPEAVTVAMLTAANRQRNPGYRAAAKLARRRWIRDGRDSTAKWLQILDLLSVNWLSPVSADDLFELYALALVLDVLRGEVGLGDPAEYGLVVPGRQHVARFRLGTDEDVVVYFDQSPVVAINTASRYQEILDAHTPPMGAARRPDVLIVRRRRSAANEVLLVEVKKTRDFGYMADSVYKAIGYVYDFSALWGQDARFPKVVLLLPENVAVRTEADLSSLEIVMLSSVDREGLARCLKGRLGLHYQQP